MDPDLVILNEFWLENMMVRCFRDNMDFGLGGQRKDVSRSIRQVRGQVMCGLGVFVGLVDSRLLIDVKTKVAGSFLPRRQH